MRISEKKKYCKTLANHLRYISGLLIDNGLIKDISPLQSVASSYQRSLSIESNTFKAVIDELQFYNIDPEQKFRKVKPSSIYRDGGLELELSGVIVAKLPLIEHADPLTELAIGIKLIAINEDEEFLINSWHIDRHIFDGDELPYFPHPIYHIQYGGKVMTEHEDLDYGNVLLVDTPRIACPPYDIALSIDYILCNYYGKMWYEFKEDDRYNEAIRHSQICFWKPYYKSISESFDNTKGLNKDFKHTDINPQLK